MKSAVIFYILIFLSVVGFLALFFLLLSALSHILTECYYNVSSCPVDLGRIAPIPH